MKKSHLLSMTAVLALLAAAPVPVLAANKATMDENPNLRDDDYITLSGTVGKIESGDEFELNYGSGKIKVDTNDFWPEMFKPDGEASNLAYRLKTGDKVTVSGRVDKSWLTENEIEAETLSYRTGSQITTFRNPNLQSNWTDRHFDYFREDGKLSLAGSVMRVVNDHEFILGYSGGNTIQVDTDGVDVPKTKPLTVGERVTVYGTFDKGLTERDEIQAEAIERSDYHMRLGSLQN